ncbi:MAG: carboxypeptidase regulatory-like domain-containing protein [Kiritimatiellae bacterium]|nr:carboxypeptidase regulatory-like domain-containing protein [Kiritimatiellia bacterium]
MRVADTGKATLILFDAGPWLISVSPTACAPLKGTLKVQLAEPGGAIARDFVVDDVALTTIRGRLLTEDGAPVAGATVEVAGTRNLTVRTLSAETERDGSFALRVLQLPDSEFEVSVHDKRIKQGRARRALSKQDIAQGAFEWRVPRSTLNLAVDVFYKAGDELVPFTFADARKRFGAVSHGLTCWRLDLRHDPYISAGGISVFIGTNTHTAYFYDLAPGDYEVAYGWVAARATGGSRDLPVLPEEYAFRVEPGSANVLRARVVVGEPPACACSGIVRDAAGGQSVGGAEVMLTWLTTTGADYLSHNAKADDEGRFSLSVPARRYELSARARNYETAKRPVVVSADTNLVVELEPRIWFRGKVLDPHGKPAPDFDVWWRAGEELVDASTDENGAFSTSELVAGKAYRVTAAGVRPGARWAADCGTWVATQHEALVVRLKNGTRIAGTVRGPELDGKKRIALVFLRHGDLPGQERTARLTADYRFEAWLLPGTYSPVIVLDKDPYLLDDILLDRELSDLRLHVEKERRASTEEIQRSIRARARSHDSQ